MTLDLDAKIAQRFERQDELDAEIWEELRQLKLQTVAQHFAIQALIETAPDLEHVSSVYMESMDIAADHISAKHIGQLADEFQRLHGAMTREIARRRGVP